MPPVGAREDADVVAACWRSVAGAHTAAAAIQSATFSI